MNDTSIYGTRNIVDLSRGRESLALGFWLQENRPDLDVYRWLRLFSGRGEAEIDFENLLGVDVEELWLGWNCPECGANGNEYDVRTCPECGSEADKKKIPWSGLIKDYKERTGELTFDSTKTPY
jgi:rubredoxin